jgi:hypothetical protein
LPTITGNALQASGTERRSRSRLFIRGAPIAGLFLVRTSLIRAPRLGPLIAAVAPCRTTACRARGPQVKKIEEYQAHAEECRAMARRARSTEEREMLSHMGRTWDDLASHRADQIARQTRMTAGPVGDGASIPIDKLNASNDE